MPGWLSTAIVILLLIGFAARAWDKQRTRDLLRQELRRKRK